MTELSGFGACRLGGFDLVAICWCSLLWLKDAVGGLTAGVCEVSHGAMATRPRGRSSRVGYAP
ncbi:MAG TPA: hypothetical protein VFR47_26855, partial [Anaerolineales bacterium]|nr:hypothetical protein [Anaerolineales bacterium]